MKLLVTRHDKIGDFVTMLPLLKAIKSQHPTVHLTVLVARVNVALTQALPYVDAVIEYTPQHFWTLCRRLRAERFDASISGFIDGRIGRLLWCAGISQRIAPATKLAQIWFNRRLTQRRSQVEKTEWAYNLDLGRTLFADLPTDVAHPLLPRELFDRFATTPAAMPKTVVLHAGSGGSTDGNLRAADYVRLARAVAMLPNVHAVFTFGPDDGAVRETIAALLAQQNMDVPLLPPFSSLLSLCAYLRDCTLFVSTSTGPMHLAGALNIGTVSFFGISRFASSLRWSPLNDPLLQSNFMVPSDYDGAFYQTVEQSVVERLR